MSDIPSVAKRIQEEETQFEAPVSQSTARKMGGTMNYLLDHYAIPPSSSMDYYGLEASIPPGWHPMDGRALSRATYANLFAVIGVLHGAGDGLTTFNLPDKRGRFSRMVDLTTVGQAGVDPDHASRTAPAGGTLTTEQPGSLQNDQYRSHAHFIPLQSGTGAPVQCVQPSFVDAPNYTPLTSAEGGNETRGKNIYNISIMKD